MWVVLTRVLTLLPCFLARREVARRRRGRELRLTPPDEKIDSALATRIQSGMALAQATYEEAFQARQRGNLEEAERLLDLASAVIERLSPSIATLLTEMMRASRTDAPMPPLRPARFRQPELASLACLHRVVNLFMVTPAQKHRLRVYILRHGWAIATSQLRASSRLRARRKAQAIWPESPWIEETREVKAAFERLFGRRPDDPLWQLAERREQWRQAPQLPAMTLWAALIIAALVVSIALR